MPCGAAMRHGLCCTKALGAAWTGRGGAGCYGYCNDPAGREATVRSRRKGEGSVARGHVQDNRGLAMLNRVVLTVGFVLCVSVSPAVGQFRAQTDTTISQVMKVRSRLTRQAGRRRSKVSCSGLRSAATRSLTDQVAAATGSDAVVSVVRSIALCSPR